MEELRYEEQEQLIVLFLDTRNRLLKENACSKVTSKTLCGHLVFLSFFCSFCRGSSLLSILSLGGTVTSKLIKNGGNKIDEAISSSIRREYGYFIGNKTAVSTIFTRILVALAMSSSRPFKLATPPVR